MERIDETEIPGLPELGGAPDPAAALGALDAASSAIAPPPVAPAVTTDEPPRRRPGRPRKDGTEPGTRKKASGAENRRRRQQQQGDTNAEGVTLTPGDMMPAAPPLPTEEEAAAAKRAERVALLASDPNAAESLRDQIAAILQLSFNGAGYVASAILGTPMSEGAKLWELSDDEELHLSKLFLRAHGADMMEHLEGGIITKTLAWGMLAKVAGDRVVAHKRIAGRA